MARYSSIHRTAVLDTGPRALDGYLDEQPDPRAALAATFGAASDAAVLARDEWDRG